MLVPKVIDFPRYNTKCRGENEILRGIFRVVSCFPLHFILYLGNLDSFFEQCIVPTVLNSHKRQREKRAGGGGCGLAGLNHRKKEGGEKPGTLTLARRRAERIKTMRPGSMVQNQMVVDMVLALATVYIHHNEHRKG